ncbi:ABC transporter permease [Fibrisoma montanum]|uniref:ABC transporter permease n=1 Tax=Fibrisoma montanum TaxID=2305895 RepID=A0A418LVT3_9BACT|nr:ABC transporter permease [Fibrisoma montanum]RIV17348.1 ABC transporter permease [Fibrisoma montanum]
MLKNYLKIAIRNLWKNRLFTIINCMGLSVGLACVVVLILFAQKCLTWDRFHTQIDRIYYVKTQTNEQTYNQTVYPILDQLLRNYPEIEAGTHIQTWSNPWIHYGTKNVQERTAYVDPAFFRIFSFAFKYGDRSTALRDKQSIILSEKIALNLFGDTNPVGKIVTINDTSQCTVTGVLDKIPANSSQQFDVILPTAILLDSPGFKENADWYNSFASVFVLLRPGADKARLEAKFPQLVNAHFSPEAKDRTVLLGAYREYIHDENPTFSGLIYGAIVIALFLLLIISINLINLNMASALPRAKEIAMRQVVGATRKLVVGQFWVESGLVVMVSVVLSVLFAIHYLIPGFNQLRDGNMQLDITWANDYPTILTILGVALLVAGVAGTYPALYLLGLKTTEAVKGKISADPHRGQLRQNALIIVQFALSIIFIIGTIGMRQQIQYMKQADLGFNKQNVLVFRTDLAYKDEQTAISQGRDILDGLRRDASVAAFTSSEVTPVQYWSNYNSYFPEGNEARQVKFRHVTGAINYFETYGIPLVEGRSFSDIPTADSVINAVVINETAMKALGWTTAVGKKLRQLNDDKSYTVIGVTKDFHYQSLKEHIEPLLHWAGGPQTLNSYLSVRLTDESKASALVQKLEAQFKKIPARRALSYFYLSDEVDKAYRPIDNIWRMIGFVAMIAILTACAGIFGLISLVTKRRTKEIGVRKVLGASVLNITALLSRDFLKLVLLAFLIGSPIAWWLGNTLLSYFAYRAEAQWWYVALAGVLTVSIALLTVSYQSVKAALMNPVKSLRTE